MGLAAGALLPSVRALAATNPADLSVVDALGMMSAKRLSARELLSACQARVAALEPTIKAFITRTDDVAAAAAAAADARYAAGTARALEGIPLGLKDLFYTKGIRTTAGSQVLADFVPEYDSTVWVRFRDAGAVLMGKLNTHEFAYGAQTPPTVNPWNTALVPAGSSGGSGAALGARFLPAATGTDTGGSIRAPSSVCGCVGMMPTYGRVSRHGIVSLVWSLDHAGPMARTVADSAHLLRVIQGPDPLDPTSLTAGVSDYPLTAPASLHGTRIGIPTTFFWNGLDASIERAARAAVDVLRSLGAEVVDVALPASFPAGTTGRPGDTGNVLGIGGATALAILAEATTYHRYLLQSSAHKYGPQTLALLQAGQGVSAVDYLAAQQQRSVSVRDLRALFSDRGIDAIVHPTIPKTPPRQVPVQSAENGADLSLTSPWDGLGVPSMTVPVGIDSSGVPVGLLFSGPHLSEANLYRIGLALEAAIDFHGHHRPSLLG
jgi:aspartyl-tRNA(Asn)/glutamyl-tRNA(Gln) amidotransferase subunit A